MIDKLISHYKIIEKLGEGGMGVLYLANDVNINRKAVLKFLPADVTNDPDINNRFKREAQAAGSLSHPNIVTIYDVGVHEGRSFIAMEYIEGKTLRELINSDELTIEKITGITIQICEGLNEAHSKGIIHRDIKPENIIIDEKGKVKILDFGLAKVKGKTQLTKDGSTLGTVKYMSPEQIRNERVDKRTDIWSVGVMLYEMITGRYPFKGEYEASLFYSIINDQPEPIARYKSGISEGFQRIIDKALDKDAETRYKHIDELLADLKREKRESTESVIIKKSSFEKGKKSKKKKYIIAASILIMVLVGFGANYLLNNSIRIINPPRHLQLTFNGNVCLIGSLISDYTQISPDGKYTAYVVNKGNIKTICVKENFSDKSYEIYNTKTIECLRWSPNSNEILFSGSILGPDKTELKIPRNFSCFIIPKFGGRAEPIHDWMWYGCWSPDGNSLALIYIMNDSIRVINRRTQEREKTIKLNGDYTNFLDIDWALRGNNFVCLTFNDKNQKYILWTIGTNGEHQQKILESNKEIYSPRWSADGKCIYYLLEKDESRDLMKIEVSDEIAENNSKVIFSGLEAYGFSLSSNNKKLVYTKYFGYSNIWKLSLEKGTKSFQQIKLTEGTNSFSGITISPNKKKIAFVSKGKIYVKSINEGEIKQISSGDFECSSPSWSPDGKDIAFFSGSDIIIADIVEGIVQRKIKNIEFGSSLFWSTDSILFFNNLLNYNLYIFNMYTNEKKELLKDSKDKGWILKPIDSPNKKKIVVYWKRLGDQTLDGLWVISTDDSVENHLLWQNVWPMEWSDDGKWIYAISYDNVPAEILKVSSTSSSVKERIKFPFDNIWGADITPDGSTIICNVGEETSDVWMIENFDPDVE